MNSWNLACLGSQTGRILAREGAAIPTNPSPWPLLWKTMLLTVLPKSHCHTPTSFSGTKTFSISIDPDMKHIEPEIYSSISWNVILITTNYMFSTFVGGTIQKTVKCLMSGALLQLTRLRCNLFFRLQHYLTKKGGEVLTSNYK